VNLLVAQDVGDYLRDSCKKQIANLRCVGVQVQLPKLVSLSPVENESHLVFAVKVAEVPLLIHPVRSHLTTQYCVKNVYEM
jgi:hypothetical protein